MASTGNDAPDDVIIDPAEIPQDHDPGKVKAEYQWSSTDDEIVIRVRHPQLPPDSKIDPGAVRQLFEWWVRTAVELAVPTVEKSVAYSAHDLYKLGRTMAEILHMDVDAMSRGQLEELGIYFYTQGKLDRWGGSISDGRKVSDDTIRDIVIYATMILRIRAAGAWPGVSLSPDHGGAQEVTD